MRDRAKGFLNMLRQWQTTIEIASEPMSYPGSEKQCLYGETVDALLVAVRTFLRERKPKYFSNIGDHVTGHFQYYYSDGKLTRKALIEEDWSPLTKDRQLSKGWWCKELAATPGSVAVEQFVEYSFGILGSFERAVQHFIRWAVIPEKGPDYQSKVLEDRSLQLLLLKRVLRETDEYVVNALIQRGWYVIALEHQGALSVKGELVNQHAVFVLGHADQEAAQRTLDAKYYHSYLKH
jgi:hypothetical protein